MSGNDKGSEKEHTKVQKVPRTSDPVKTDRRPTKQPENDSQVRGTEETLVFLYLGTDIHTQPLQLFKPKKDLQAIYCR